MNEPSGPVYSMWNVMRTMDPDVRSRLVAQIAKDQQERKARHDNEYLTQDLNYLVEEFGFDVVMQRLRNIGASLGPTPGTSLDARR